MSQSDQRGHTHIGASGLVCVPLYVYLRLRSLVRRSVFSFFEDFAVLGLSLEISYVIDSFVACSAF